MGHKLYIEWGGCVATFNARGGPEGRWTTSPSLVRRPLLLAHLIDVILLRCALWPAFSVRGTYSYGLLLMVWANSRNVFCLCESSTEYT